jgi:D-glutamate cyclase
MSRDVLHELCTLIQDDINGRGLRADPERNLINAYPRGLREACTELAAQPDGVLAVVTGFIIPTATPVAAETDGPLGALFLARALPTLGIRVALLTDDFAAPALHAGLHAAQVADVPVVVLPAPKAANAIGAAEYRRRVLADNHPTHLLAIERVGPSHIIAAIPAQQRDRCHTMRGRDVTEMMSPAHWLFENPGCPTIGIGDGGNEIGMGAIPWDVIRRNIPGGDVIACRVPTDDLVVCGISNWGAYALASGVAWLQQRRLEGRLFDGDNERSLLQTMVDEGPLVDGVLGQQVATVDGLSWERYADVLERIGAVGV